MFSKCCCCSVIQLRPTLCDPLNCSKPGFPILYQLLELAQMHVHLVNDTIQLSHPLSYPSPSAFNLSEHQGLFQWVSSSHQVAKVLVFQLQHQSRWIVRTDFLQDWLVWSPCSPRDSQESSLNLPPKTFPLSRKIPSPQWFSPGLILLPESVFCQGQWN